MSALTRVYPSAATQSIPNNAWTPIVFGNVRRDDNGMWSAGSPDRITVPTGKAGVYALSGTLRWTAVAGGVRGIALQANGATFWAVDANATGTAATFTDLSIATIAYLSLPLGVADYLQLMAYQTSGAALNVITLTGGGGELSAALLT